MYCKEKWRTAGRKGTLFGRVDGFRIDPKLKSHREASTSQGISPRPGEEAIWLLFTSPQPWKPSGAVLFAPVRESFFLDNPPLF